MSKVPRDPVILISNFTYTHNDFSSLVFAKENVKTDKEFTKEDIFIDSFGRHYFCVESIDTKNQTVFICAII